MSKAANLHASRDGARRRVFTFGLPHSALLAQGMRYALTGCVVLIVYLVTTSVFSLVFGLPFQVALAIGFSVGMLVHFSLQRLFVWTDHDGFALAFPSQVGRYLLVATIQYGVTVASTAFIPYALGLPTEPVYLATALLVTFVNFLLFRNYIFHGNSRSSRR